MPRPRTISDAAVFAATRQKLAAGGDKAVTFASVARATGLAAPTLVQRYATREAMVRAALLAAWDGLEAATAKAEAGAEMTAKGAQAILKVLTAEATDIADLSRLAADFRDPALRCRATNWRQQIEAALSARLGDGAKGREAAAMLFALWQGQLLWQAAGDKGFRLKDAVKRISG